MITCMLFTSRAIGEFQRPLMSQMSSNIFSRMTHCVLTTRERVFCMQEKMEYMKTHKSRNNNQHAWSGRVFSVWQLVSPESLLFSIFTTSFIFMYFLLFALNVSRNSFSLRLLLNHTIVEETESVNILENFWEWFVIIFLLEGLSIFSIVIVMYQCLRRWVFFLVNIMFINHNRNLFTLLSGLAPFSMRLNILSISSRLGVI